jgi:hypothetical protein
MPWGEGSLKAELNAAPAAASHLIDFIEISSRNNLVRRECRAAEVVTRANAVAGRRRYSLSETGGPRDITPDCLQVALDSRTGHSAKITA